MTLLYRLLFITLFSIANISIQSQEILNLNSDQFSKPIKLAKHIDYLEDKNGEITFEQIFSNDLDWRNIQNENVNFGFNSSFFWIRFTLSNTNLEIVKPILEINWARQDYIEFYNHKKGNFKIITTGDKSPFEKREIYDTNFAFELELEPKTTKTYYIRTRSEDNISMLNPTLHSSFLNFHKETSFRDITNGILFGFLVIMIFYNLFLFVIIREKVYLYLSFYIFSFAFTIFAQHGLAFQYLYPQNPYFASIDLTFTVPFILIFQLLFVHSYLELKIKLLSLHKTLYIHILLIAIYQISLQTIFNKNTEFKFYSILSIVFIENIYCLIIGIYLSLKKFRPAYFYLFSFSMVLFGTILRILAASSLIPVTFFTFWSFQFGLLIMLILISIGLADKINYLKRKLIKTNQKLRNYSDILEEKINERTNELQVTLNKVNNLKKQQDGDYFLTSLLLEPFVANKGKSEKVKIEFLLIQKKKFEFYGKEQNIGGDLCHTQNIFINSRKYILFFNSDAMGKSLQGAGGAIVFGSVFFSIIQRTKSNPIYENISPERWLKNAFVELHKVFLTFECTMLVSAVIGLIEEETGLLYYINAEHPWLVLYANNDSYFIEKDVYFTKLGSPVDSNKVFINLYQMRENDIIFIGSDGKDDFVPKQSNEFQVLNQDEKEFLRVILEAKGDLTEVYRLTSEKGEIIDDYSLLKIEFLGENIDYSNLKKMSLLNYHDQNVENCLKYGLEYTSKNPSDTDFLLFLGSVFKSEELYEMAISFLERVRLRNPYHLENLLLLIDSYYLIHDFYKTKKLVKDYLTLDPTNQSIIKLNNELVSNATLSSRISLI